jgi:Ran GTPase-activating protein (RanGAP) involved in mRNA processing and transport
MHLYFCTQTLTTLDLSDNEIGADGAQHLADALRNNTVTVILHSSISYMHLYFCTQTLTTLDLSDNEIGADGAQHLADALRNNTVTLILSSCISYSETSISEHLSKVNTS